MNKSPVCSASARYAKTHTSKARRSRVPGLARRLATKARQRGEAKLRSVSPSTSSRRAWRRRLTTASASSRLRSWVADCTSMRSSSRNSRARCLAWMGHSSGRSLPRCQADTVSHCSASAAAPLCSDSSSLTWRPNSASVSCVCSVSSTWPKMPIRLSSVARRWSCRSSSCSLAAAWVRRMRRSIISTSSSRQRIRDWRSRASRRVSRLPGCVMS